MNKMLFVLIFFSVSTLSNSQEITKKNIFFIEAFGNGLFASINYERLILNNNQIAFRCGLGSYFTTSINSKNITIPISVNYILNLYKHNANVDFGFGLTYSKADVRLYVMVKPNELYNNNQSYFNYIPSIGYRYHTESNLMWRISFTPIINNYGFLPYLSLSLGKLF